MIATAQDTTGTATLTDEHALLLRQVAVRVDELLDVTRRGSWPARELQSLVDYLHAEVLRQATNEEWLLFPTGGAGQARLGRDHARLRAVTEALTDAAVNPRASSPARVGAMARDLLMHLERHLIAEEQLLTAACPDREPPSTFALGSPPHDLYLLTEGPVIDVDALPAGQAINVVVQRLLRLRAGERVELRSHSDLNEVWWQLDRIDPQGYGFVYLPDRPQWTVEVTRRSPY